MFSIDQRSQPHALLGLYRFDEDRLTSLTQLTVPWS